MLSSGQTFLLPSSSLLSPASFQSNQLTTPPPINSSAASLPISNTTDASGDDAIATRRCISAASNDTTHGTVYDSAFRRNGVSALLYEVAKVNTNLLVWYNGTECISTSPIIQWTVTQTIPAHTEMAHAERKLGDLYTPPPHPGTSVSHSMLQSKLIVMACWLLQSLGVSSGSLWVATHSCLIHWMARKTALSRNSTQISGIHSSTTISETAWTYHALCGRRSLRTSLNILWQTRSRTLWMVKEHLLLLRCSKTSPVKWVSSTHSAPPVHSRQKKSSSRVMEYEVDNKKQLADSAGWRIQQQSLVIMYLRNKLSGKNYLSATKGRKKDRNGKNGRKQRTENLEKWSCNKDRKRGSI